MEHIDGIIQSILKVFSVTWWIVIPAALFFIWNEFWVLGKRISYLRSLKWAMLEIKIPKDILKTPKAMENIFSAMHTLYFADPGWEDMYFEGRVLPWFTFEMVGMNGGVGFYARVPAANRNLLESAVYSEYPEAEINQVDDYIETFPEVLPNDAYDLWGNDYILAKENAYPIRTYDFFESPDEDQRLDPISAITEVMSRLREGEAIWLQYLVRPVNDTWKKEGEAIRDKIMQRKKDAPAAGGVGALVEGAFHFGKNLAAAPLQYPTWPGGAQEKKPETPKFVNLSPGETEVLKRLEGKISKLGFESAIRFVYIDRKDSFTQANVSAIAGAFKQYNTQNLNAFKALSDTITFITGKRFTTKSWFRKSKVHYRKRRIYDAYRARAFPAKFSVMNSEELATVFHFPITSVESPLLRRLPTRKGEPPSGLPIVD